MTNDRFWRPEPIDKAAAIATILEHSDVHATQESPTKTKAQREAERERVRAADRLFGIEPGDRFSPETMRKFHMSYDVGDPEGEEDIG